MDLSSSPVTVSFDGQGLRLDTSEDAEVICNELDGKEVERLILQGNTFGIEAAERVGISLAKQQSLREAHFKDLFTSRGREIVPEALSHLLDGISNSGAQLALLDLSDNAIGPLAAPSVIKFLESPSASTIEELYFNNNGLGPEGSTSIAASIPNLKNLRVFICGRNRLENKGAASMSRALSELRTIEVLKVNQNGIHVTGIQALVGAMKANLATIREFDFSDNTIMPEGAEAIAQFILSAKSLERIQLDDALLGNKGFTTICKALAKSPYFGQLSSLSCEGNELSGQKLVDMIESTFRNCGQGLQLDLLENEFSPIELGRLEALRDSVDIIVDEVDDQEYADDDSDNSDYYANDNSRNYEAKDESDREDLNGYVDLSNYESDLREVAQDFISATSTVPPDTETLNSTFIQLISTGQPQRGKGSYQLVQVLCEELGLIKMEQTRKKKELARSAIVYIGKRVNELPPTFRDFFEAVVKNNDDLTSCGKLLFEKLEV